MKFKLFKELLSKEKDYEFVDNINDEEEITHTTKIKIKHLKCGKSYEAKYKYFRRGRRCPHCFGSKKRTTENVKKDLFNLVGDEYTLQNDYKGCTKNMTFKHKVCGKEFETTYWRFFGKKENHQSNRCPFCSHGSKLKTLEEFREDVRKIVGDEYSVIGDYKGNKTKVHFRHNKCGHTFFMGPTNFLSLGQRCSYCRNSSIGENKILDILRENNIKYTPQFRIKDCKDKKPLPFDFKIEREDGSWFLLEYNGTQHYLRTGSVPFATESLKKHDKMKRDYCEKNNIDLLTISFKDFDNIEKIIKEKMISTTIL